MGIVSQWDPAMGDDPDIKRVAAELAELTREVEHLSRPRGAGYIDRSRVDGLQARRARLRDELQTLRAKYVKTTET
jgi:hypothetical protein